MDFVTIVLCAVLLVLLTPLLVKLVQGHLFRRHVAAHIERLPGPPWYPIIGSTLELLKAGRKNFWKAYSKRNQDYGPLFRTWMGMIPSVHMMKAEHIEIILRSNENITKGPNYRFVTDWLGAGLLTANGKHWHSHRKMITPTFHFSILDSFQDVYSEKSQQLVELLASKANGQYFDIAPYLSYYALDVICETAMGTKINAIGNADSEYVKAIYGMSELSVARMFKGLYHNNFIYKFTGMYRKQKEYLRIIHGFDRKVIHERREKMANRGHVRRQLSEEDKLMGKKERKAFLDLLLEDQSNNNLTDEEIRQEVDTFMFAGHDTTSVTSLWALFALANNPDIQEKVYNELEEIFQGEERPITPEDLGQMKYFDRVLKEVLRLHNIVPAVARTLDKEITVDGHRIPVGCMVVIHLHELHRDPDQFPEPEKFDPDRFLPENAAKRHPYAYIPFSAGPRNCIGQKFAGRNNKTVLASILRRFKVTTTNTMENTELFAEIVLRPQNGLSIALEERRKTN